jgi:hypothetical protein
MQYRTYSQFVHALIAIGILSYAECGYAGTADSGQSMFSISGFGTLGVVHSSEYQADFISNGTQPKGAGFTGSWSATPDSKFGVQLNAHFTDRLSVVLQAVSQYEPDGTYRPALAWGNIKYQVTLDFDIRVGRIALPTYMYSDFLNVGYSLPYVRIPIEIYSLLPVSSSDGVDGSYRFHMGDATNTLQAFAGRFDESTPNGGYYKIRDLRGIVDIFEYGALTLHLSYQTLRYDVSSSGFLVRNDPQAIASIGGSYDPGKWFVLGEWVRTPDAATGLYYGWYVIGGRRFGKFTPYIDHAHANLASAGTLGESPAINQDTNTLGLRWDVLRNLDLKLQLDHTKLHGGGNYFFVNQQPGFREAGTVNIVSLALDFVF